MASRFALAALLGWVGLSLLLGSMAGASQLILWVGFHLLNWVIDAAQWLWVKLVTSLSYQLVAVWLVAHAKRFLIVEVGIKKALVWLLGLLVGIRGRAWVRGKFKSIKHFVIGTFGKVRNMLQPILGQRLALIAALVSALIAFLIALYFFGLSAFLWWIGRIPGPIWSVLGVIGKLALKLSQNIAFKTVMFLNLKQVGRALARLLPLSVRQAYRRHRFRLVRQMVRRMHLSRDAIALMRKNTAQRLAFAREIIVSEVRKHLGFTTNGATKSAR